MNLAQVEYPLRLCVELLWFCFWSCDKTKDMKPSEIRQLVGNFFSEDDIEKAIAIIEDKPCIEDKP